VSSDLSSSIIFNNTTSFNDLSLTWKTIAKYYKIKTPPLLSSNITNFTIPIKNFGNSPFTIRDPSSNSTGAFSYSSSNQSVATISGKTITIVGAGSSTITATQAATMNYSQKTATITFQVNKSTSTVPALVSNFNEILFFISSLSRNAAITNSININKRLNLKSSSRKKIFSKGTKQIKL